jgi:DNA-binding transcriptional regulator LsrR (DeoR family)
VNEAGCCVTVDGGDRKCSALRASRGRWVDVLITDLGVARRLVEAS